MYVAQTMLTLHESLQMIHSHFQICIITKQLAS